MSRHCVKDRLRSVSQCKRNTIGPPIQQTAELFSALQPNHMMLLISGQGPDEASRNPGLPALNRTFRIKIAQTKHIVELSPNHFAHGFQRCSSEAATFPHRQTSIGDSQSSSGLHPEISVTHSSTYSPSSPGQLG